MTEEIRKCVLQISDDLRRLADCLSTCTETDARTEPVGESTAVPVTESPKQPEIKLEDVRKVLADKSRSGKTAEVRSLIQKYGSDKLSEVDPNHYADLLKDAEEL